MQQLKIFTENERTVKDIIKNIYKMCDEVDLKRKSSARFSTLKKKHYFSPIKGG